MDLPTREILSKTYVKVKVYSSGQMGKNIKENGRTTNSMEKVSSINQLVKSTLEDLQMESGVVKEWNKILIRNSTKEIGLMVKKMENSEYLEITA